MTRKEVTYVKETIISKLIVDYKDKITFGTFTLNSNTHIPYSKEYWFPECE